MGLVNAGIMIGLLALGIPIVIHLLRSRRYQPADLGTLRFLRLAVHENARWRRIQDLLLLLLRLLIVALLTFLFARPFLRARDEERKGRIDALLLIDASGSMNGRTLGVKHFDLAKEAAAKALRELPDSAKVTVAAFADRTIEIPDFAESSIIAGGRTDYAAALSWARDRLALSSSEHKQVVLFTDMQKAGLPEDSIKDWPFDAPVKFVTVPQGAWNAAITGVQTTSPYLGRGLSLEVTLSCFGAAPAGEAQLTLEVEGQGAQTRSVPLRTGRVAFQIPRESPGLCRGVVRVQPDDAYAEDNARHFAFLAQAPNPVLLVDGKPGKTPFEGAAYFVETALRVAKRDDGQSAFAPERRETLGDPGAFRVVALCNVGQLEEAEIARLRARVEAGCGLVHFLGDRARPEVIEALAAQGLFPGTAQLTDAPVPRLIADWDAEHPALKLFDDRERGDLSRIVFRDAFRFELNDSARVLAKLSNGAPAMVEATLGRGRILVVSNPANRDWSDWPTERVFLPVIHELLTYLAGEQGAPAIVVEKVAGLDDPRGPGIYFDQTPSTDTTHGTNGTYGTNGTGKIAESQLSDSSHTSRLSHASASPSSPQITVLVTDPREADIRGADEAEFRRALGVGEAPRDDKALAQQVEVPPKSERKNEIWLYLALALVSILFAENTLSDRRQT